MSNEHTRPSAEIDPGRLATLRAALLAWFEEHKRALPWRAAADPYAVWVAEVMLQQTQVSTVLPYYERWMERFPTVEALAVAPRDAVLEAWQGLGYYARARHLHEAAQQVVDQHAGRVPRRAAELRQLPGIGPYTAGAIASIAFDEPVPAVDGNVRRVLARLFAVEGDVTRGPPAQTIEDIATSLVQGLTNDDPSPGTLNEALMELGATVCIPDRPRCLLCPVHDHCRARQQGRETELPAPRKRAKQQTDHWWAFLLLRHDDTVLVARRPPQGLLGGLWEPPMAIAPSDADPVAVARAALGLQLEDVRLYAPITHVFTHLRLTATPVLAVATKTVTPVPDALAAPYTTWRWVPPDEVADRPTSVLTDKLLAAVAQSG